MNFAPYEPYEPSPIELSEMKKRETLNRIKIKNNIKLLIKTYKLIELKSDYFGMDSYYLLNNKEIVKINNLTGELSGTSGDESQHIYKLNEIK